MSIDAAVTAFRGAGDPERYSIPLQALWHDAHGSWGRAHDLAQAANSRDGDWVHAYLHRKEGDEANAGYWYARARRALPSMTLEQEWAAIVAALLPNETTPEARSGAPRLPSR